MSAVRLAVLAVAAAVALTATDVRIGDHPAYVRVVLDFNGTVPVNQVEFRQLTSTMATLQVNHPGIKTQTMGSSGQGVHVALQPGTQALHIAASFAAHRFKYVSYTVVGGNRVAIDLWKSTPPPNDTDSGVRRCLSLMQVATRSGSGSVDVSGTERRVFEHTFQVMVRGATGRVLGRRTVIHGGSWGTTVHYHVTRRQAGTVEAVALSAKDGSLACLAQWRVTLFAS